MLRRPVRIGLLALTAALPACQSGDQATQPTTTTTTTTAQALRATPGGADILTFGGDNGRTGWNRHETTLTPANVRPETFGLVAVSPDVGDEITGAPVFASNIPVHDIRSGQDVMADTVFVGTMDNKVFALDADDLGAFWTFDYRMLGYDTPSAGNLSTCLSDFHTGIMSTPVISPDKSTIYVVGRVVGSSPNDAYFLGFALNTRDGSVRARFRVGETLGADGTTRTQAAYDGFDHGNPVHVTFQNGIQNQRGALLLVNNTLYVAVGGTCSVPGYIGWIFAFDTNNLSEQTPPVATFVPSPGGGGGMWAAGGPASDGNGIYVTTGNGRASLRVGSQPANRSYADGMLHLGADLRLDDMSCFNVADPNAACGGGDVANVRNVFMPRYAELLGRDAITDMDPYHDIGSPDQDFGITGAVLIPAAELPENAGTDMGRRLAGGGGKDGFYYLIDRDRMGGVGPSSLNVAEDVPNLVGAELDGLQLASYSTSGGIRGTAAYFETHSGRYLYVMGADEIAQSANAPRGLAALRIVPKTDPTAAECAAQYRHIVFQDTAIGCSTIWGSTTRPGLQLAWTGSGPLNGASPFVSSNGYDDGVVWVTFEHSANGGLLEAFAADGGAGTGGVMTPIYRSDRVPSDALPGSPGTFTQPIVANGRVYVTGSTFVAAYGNVPARTVPPLPDQAPPPDCAPGVTWENTGSPFMQHYCTRCHQEYNDLGFTQRRNTRVADSLMGLNNVRPMPPEGTAGVEYPTDAERQTMDAWLRCGAPAGHTRMHAGFGNIAAFVGDNDTLDPNQTGVLTSDQLGAATLNNPFSHLVPDPVFRIARTGPTEYRVPVPGQGHYAVTLYMAENGCTGGADCNQPFNVQVAGQPWLTGFDIFAAAGATHTVIARSMAVDMPATSQLRIDVTAPGKIHAIEVERADACTTSDTCPIGFECTNGVCVVNGERADGGVGADVNELDSGWFPDAGTSTGGDGSVNPGGDGSVNPGGDGGTGGMDGGVVRDDAGHVILPDGAVVGPDGAIIGSEPTEHHGCSCSTPGHAGGARAPLGLLAVGAVVSAAASRRRRR